MPDLESPETWKWLITQGALAIVLVLVLIDRKRNFQQREQIYDQLLQKLEGDRALLVAVVKDNTASNIELREECRRWSRVTEEAFPRGGRRDYDPPTRG